MRRDAVALAGGTRGPTGPSKETLNHPGIIAMATGRDPWLDAPRAFGDAYRKLGIDIVNRVPDTPAPSPTPPGETRDLPDGYVAAHLGVYDTVSRRTFPFETVEDFLRADPEQIVIDYRRLRTPVPHSLDRAEIARRQALLGDVGLYYYQLYTTLFMWGVEYLGWEVFLLAGALDPDRLDRGFLAPAFEESRRLIEELAKTDCPFVFCHDDLADKRGPVFSPDWYDAYVFPRYPALFAPAKAAGKRVVFVADGNMEPFLERLLSTGVDGVMLENPATDFQAIVDAFGDKIIIGGIDTSVLQHGSGEEIRDHVLSVHEQTVSLPGFAMSTPGGLHGSLSTASLEAYFDARVITGHTPPSWRAT